MSTKTQQVREEDVTTGDQDLPEGWIATLMGEISSVVGGSTPDTSEVGNFSLDGHAWITPADLSGFRELYIARGARGLSDKGLRSCSAAVMPAGTVLMSSRAPIGYLAIAANPVSTNQGFKSFVCPTGIVPEYCYFWLKYRRPDLEGMGSGSTFLEISGSRAKEIPISLAPTVEQRRISEKLQSLLVTLVSPRSRLERVRLITKRFRQAVLAAACSGKLTEDWRVAHPHIEPSSVLLDRIQALRQKTRSSIAGRKFPKKTHGDDEPQEHAQIPDSWDWCKVGQIATVCLGGTPSRKQSEYWNGTIPWVSSGEVANCRIVSTRETITAFGLENSNAKIYPKGTVLIAMIGEGKTRGQSAILDVEACTNQNVAGLVFDAGNIRPEYVWFWALSEYERTRAVGRGGSQPALNGEKVRNLVLPLPPLEEQREIVRRGNALFALMDAIEKRVAAASLRTEKLTEAVLAKAFRGELVPTEAELARREARKYEPASVLLERIKAERAKVVKEKEREKEKG